MAVLVIAGAVVMAGGSRTGEPENAVARPSPSAPASSEPVVHPRPSRPAVGPAVQPPPTVPAAPVPKPAAAAPVVADLPAVPVRAPVPSVAAADSEGPQRVGGRRDDNGLRLALVWCPAGKFVMGSPSTEPKRDADGREDQVQVELSQGFWLGQTEVTQEQWRRVMQSEPWHGKGMVMEGENFPAGSIRHADALEFCAQLTQLELQAGRLPAGWEYTLPTEAQWEYACRAGSSTRYYFGEDAAEMPQHAWCYQSTGRERYGHEVGLKLPNAWGLHDMYGNLQEWCRDWYTTQLPGGTDPEVTEPGTVRVLRGGGFGAQAVALRTAFRRNDSPDVRFVGFRVALVPTGPSR